MSISTLGQFLAQRRTFLLGLFASPVAAASAATTSGEPLYKRAFTAFDGKSLDQKIQELADREEIRELVHRYAQRIVHDVSPADLFTDDGAFIIRNPDRPVQETRGRVELDKLFAGYIARVNPPPPMIHNHIISISGNEASSICSLEVGAPDKGPGAIRSGYYLDTFRRVNGRWKFVVREPTFFN